MKFSEDYKSIEEDNKIDSFDLILKQCLKRSYLTIKILKINKK